MNKISVILLVILFTFPGIVNSRDVDKRDKLRSLVEQYGQSDIAVPFESLTETDRLSRNLSVWSVDEKNICITISPYDIDWFLKQNLKFEVFDNKGLEGLVTASGTDQAMEWDTYPTYTQYDSIMKKFASLYPSLCRLDTIGSTGYGKHVLVLKISDNVLLDENEPEVFYTSSMHGDETGGFVLMLHLIDYLLKNYNTIPEVRNLVDNLSIWINPLANPDGTYRTGNTITSPVRYNSEGVDLNRKFPDPLDPSIVVPYENRDMIRFMRRHRFILSANFHAGAEVVNYPWDRYLDRLHADDAWFLSVSRAYADTVHNYSTPVYMDFMENGVTRGALWYKIYGGRQDFVTSELQGREVTIELDDIKTTPAAQLGLLWMYNKSSLLGYLENALYGIHGTVRDSLSLEPVGSRIFISGHDRDSSHIYSDTLNGTFVRMLSPGTYDLTFSADGYITKTVRGVNVTGKMKTSLVVDLEPGPSIIESPVYTRPVFYPNPVTERLTVLLPDGLTGEVHAEILTAAGRLVSDLRFFHNAGEEFNYDVGSLKNGAYFMRFTADQNAACSVIKFLVVK